MLDALEQRRARDGIVLRMIRPPVPATSEVDLSQLYEAAITTRTRLVLVTHASNVTGQLYPVQRIAAAAHKVGAEVVIDAAQTLALLPHTIADLDCDYYGASLHKWLSAPVGSGVLWMRKAHVDKIWPLVPPGDAVGMHRFMNCGTYPEPIAAAITAAIDLHERIGAARKADRLRHLTRYWRRKVEALPGVRFYTTEAPESSCGLAVFEVGGVDSDKLRDHLWDRHRIVVQSMRGKGRAPEIHGIRVTPNVYTLVTDLDRLVNAVERVVKRGL
jgi:selenocysteine lyase/cysteine desulfurase